MYIYILFFIASVYLTMFVMRGSLFMGLRRRVYGLFLMDKFQDKDSFKQERTADLLKLVAYVFLLFYIFLIMHFSLALLVGRSLGNAVLLVAFILVYPLFYRLAMGTQLLLHRKHKGVDKSK